MINIELLRENRLFITEILFQWNYLKSSGSRFIAANNMRGLYWIVFLNNTREKLFLRLIHFYVHISFDQTFYEVFIKNDN